MRLGLFALTFISLLQLQAPPSSGTFVLESINGKMQWVAPTSETIPQFADAEVPVGIVNGTNNTFTVAHADSVTGASLILTRNGIVLQTGMGNDYLFTVLNGVGTITFNPGAIPQSGDILQAWYRY